MSTYGTGADGALNFDGTATVLGLSPTTLGGFKVYTLASNVNASSITIASGVKIFLANWKLFCTGMCTGAGSAHSFIHCNGPDAPAAVAGGTITNASAIPAGFFDVGAPGNSGSSGNVTNAIPSPITTTGAAAAGSTGGGAVSPGADGPSHMKGGGGGSIWNANQSFAGVAGGNHTALVSSSGYTQADQANGIPADNPTTKYRWASGGGQGTQGAIGPGGGTNPCGGGGGAGAGCAFVAAQTISGVTIQANGGKGGDGAAGTIGTSAGGGGGGGGGGGILILYFDSNGGDVVTQVSGGAPGLAATHGVGCLASDGGRGADGWLYIYDGTAGSPGSVYWGPHFPDASGLGYYFGPHFPDGKISTTSIPPSTPGGAATFTLLESGSKLQLSYGEDSINQKMWSGAEYRESMLDDPKRTFVGAATLLGSSPIALRAQLARFAATGTVFGLGIPYEAITTTGAATSGVTGFTIPTSSTAVCDWMQVGQRVAFTDESSSTSLEAVLQGFTSNSVTIDEDPGALGRVGVTIMPIVPVLLDPAMPMVRFRGTTGVEQWQLNARAAVFGYPVAANKAFALLSASTGVLAAGAVSWAAIGAAANGTTLTLVGDGTGSGNVTNAGSAYTFHFQPGVTTVFAMQIALDIGPGFFNFTNVDPGAVLVAGDAVGPLTLHGGTDLGYGTQGAGATVATYDGRPFWDRRIQVQDTASDSIQSLAELVDMGGIPISIGTATQPDWGRALLLNRELGTEFQWIKAFLAACRGCQRAFWLPSYRQDLVGASWSGSNLIVSGPGDAFGDLASWWPLQRDRIQVQQADGTLVLAKITAAVDNGNGTLTLTLGTVQGTPSGAAVTRVSWLELCRFDSPNFEITFPGHGQFSMPTTARVVQG